MDVKGKSAGRNSAVLVNSIVWVSSLSADTSSILNVLEGMRWKTTLTSVVVKGLSAVNKLLLGKWGELTILEQLVGLKSTNGGEGPA